MAFKYLTFDDLVMINRKMVGELSALRDQGLLESAAMRPQASAFGQDAYETVFDKAAALLHSIVLNHAFVDGNKRTGTTAMITFLDINGVSRVWDYAEAVEFIVNVAEGKYDVPAIAAWLEAHTQPKG